jgi:hypothetical protein
MRKFRFHPVVLLLFLVQSLFAQEKTTPIPFQLTAYNNIAIPAILNDIDTVILMFHTAANAVTLTEDANKKIKSIAFNKTTDSIKSWGGGDNSARMSENNTLKIGDITFKDIAIWENKYSGQNTDGKFGIDLFKDKVIQVDFEKKLITLSFNLPRKVKKYEKLKLTVEDDMLFVEGSCAVDKRVFQNNFLIHSGYSGAILLDDKFANDNKLGEKLKIIGEKDLKDSYGNVVKTKKAILPVLKIGNQKLLDVPVGFFEGALGRQKMSIMGGDVLKRFNIIIDAQRAYIYLKVNKLNKDKYSNI